MNNVTIYEQNMPATVEELVPYVLIGEEKIKAYRAKLAAVRKLNLSLEIEKAALTDAQRMGEAVIMAKARVGELLKENPPGLTRDKSGKIKQNKLPDGISQQSSHQAQTIAKNPDIVERAIEQAIEADKIPTPDLVYKLIKKEEAQARVEAIRQKRVENPDGTYDVIVIDPPWPMEKIERDCAPNQHAFGYPTMEIFCQWPTVECDHRTSCGLLNEEPCNSIECQVAHLFFNKDGEGEGVIAENCHVFLWTTHKFLPDALRLLDEWSLNYICTFVWHKPGGFQPFGLPQYNCEFVLYARHGAPKFIDTKAFNVCFDAPRGAHSEKPEAFYETLRRVTYGKRLDMYNRRKIDGFDGWGNESGE